MGSVCRKGASSTPSSKAPSSAVRSAMTPCSGVRAGMRLKRTATAPATGGQASEVPDIVLVSESEPIHAEVMSLPGA